MGSKIIEARRWKNVITGATASVWGAVPYTTAEDCPNWLLETVGYTIAHPDGTVGIGRKPFATFAEAQAWVDAHPRFSGIGSY